MPPATRANFPRKSKTGPNGGTHQSTSQKTRKRQRHLSSGKSFLTHLLSNFVLVNHNWLLKLYNVIIKTIPAFLNVNPQDEEEEENNNYNDNDDNEDQDNDQDNDDDNDHDDDDDDSADDNETPNDKHADAEKYPDEADVVLPTLANYATVGEDWTDAYVDKILASRKTQSSNRPSHDVLSEAQALQSIFQRGLKMLSLAGNVSYPTLKAAL